MSLFYKGKEAENPYPEVDHPPKQEEKSTSAHIKKTLSLPSSRSRTTIHESQYYSPNKNSPRSSQDGATNAALAFR
jgi:hypothetical protein